MRPIDADALKEHIKKRIRNEMIIAWLFRIIDEVSTIDPASLRPKGEWVKDEPFLVCLNCESEIDIKNCLGVENRKNFCPNCGADMRGEGDG